MKKGAPVQKNTNQFVDGKTYGNICMLKCENAHKFTLEESIRW